MSPTIRRARAADGPACGRILYEAFKGIGAVHNFPPDYASVAQATEFLGHFIDHPGMFAVVAEIDGRVVGSNFLEERDPIRSVGPISVEPSAQGRGVGRLLMEAVVERGRGAAGVRLVQDAFNTASMSLYAALGFEAKEPLALMSGVPRSTPPAGAEVRPLRDEHLEDCAALSKQVLGWPRDGELRDAVRELAPFVLPRDGRIVAYASAMDLWLLNHGVAEAENDMKTLLLGAAAAIQKPIALMVPIRQASLFRWCLQEGLRVVKPLTLMTTGGYRDPAGCWFPSISY